MKMLAIGLVVLTTLVPSYAETYRSGIFRILALPENGLFTKIADDGPAVEAASIGADILISYGAC